MSTLIDTWFDVAGEPTLGFLHIPGGGTARAGVVICPPLGHEQVIAYRALRFFGQQLAAEGIAALRFDYLGQGDASGISADPDAVESWLASIEAAVRYLRDSGVENITLAGLTSGGLLAVEAARRVRDVTALVLWDPTLSGRRFVRRQKSIHDMTVGDDTAHSTELVSLLSMTLHVDAAKWLEGAEITATALEEAGVPTLLVGRAADKDNSATRRLLEALPANVEYRAVTGQEELLDVASSIAVIPNQTIDGMVAWLDPRLPVPVAPVVASVTTEATVGSVAGVPVVERLGRFGSERIFTIETRLGDSTAAHDRGLVVMQPAAAEHRIGPGRFQVQAARELAARGYRALRFDRRISGETTEVDPTEPNMVMAKEWVADAGELATAVAGGAPIALVGLCSGAWVSARVAERTGARLTVLMDINYYRTRPLVPGEYARRARLDQHGEPQLGKVRHGLRERIPAWLWRAASPTQVFNDPTLLLTPPTRVPDSTIALLLTPEDDQVLAKNRGMDAIMRLRAGGANIHVTRYPFGDHALFGDAARTAMLRDTVALVEAAIPAVPAAALTP